MQLSTHSEELARHGLSSKWLMKEGKAEIRMRTRKRVQPQWQAPAGQEQAADGLAALQQRTEALLAAQYPPVIEGALRTLFMPQSFHFKRPTCHFLGLST